MVFLYQIEFFCSFGYETVKILVKGQGGLPNCIETRLDIPFYTERVIREAYRKDVVCHYCQMYSINELTHIYIARPRCTDSA